MKTVNLFALGQLSFEDFGGFLSWLANIAAAEVNVSQILKSPPIRSSKINPVLKVLEQFAMISNRKGCISITRAGREFVNADAAKRKSIVREPLLGVEAICRVQELLKSSATGRGSPIPIFVAYPWLLDSDRVRAASPAVAGRL